MSVYYPSALAVLRVRLDERTPGEPLATAALGTPGLTGALASGGTYTAALGPIGVSGPGDPLSYVEGVKPSRVVVRRRTYREPDEASIVIPAEYLPLDPRNVRALAVDIYLGAVPASLYGAGMASGNAALSTVLGTPDNQVFMGYADEGTWDFGDGTIELELRGLQSLLTDTHLGPSVLDEIPLEQPLHAVVWSIVQSAPMARGMKVAARLPIGSAPAAIPVVAAALGPAALRLTKAKKKGPTHLAVEDGASTYWDLISRVCLLSGWVPSVELDTVVLRPAATLRPGLAPQHYVDVYWPSGASTGIPYQRALWWGENLEGLRLTRPWGSSSRKPIEIRQWSQELGETITARWPLSPTPSKVAANGRVADEEVEVITVSGLNPASMFDHVRAIYEERASRDMRGSFETREITSQALSTAEAPIADLMRLRPGDDVLLGIKPERPETGTQGTAPAIYGRTTPELIAFLVERGFSSATAAAFALHLTTTPLLNTFRISEAAHTFDEEEGYSLSAEFSSYLIAGFVDA